MNRRHRTRAPLAVALALASASILSARCGNDPEPQLIIPPPPPDPNPCTPTRAGLDGAPELSFAYYHPPENCVLDPIGRAGSCNVGGCTVKNAFELITSEATMQQRIGCMSPAASGVDFSTSRIVFVRQGLRVGEAMGVQPIAWMVQQNTTVTLGENRRSFCTGGQPLTGGVVSYALTIPIPTSSTATIARHVCFKRVRCDCTEEEACGG